MVYFFSVTLSAEGVRELRPDSAYSSADLTIDNGISGLNYYPPFARINCPPNYRLYIHIENPGEKILFGLKCTKSYLQYNLRKPDGTIAISGICPYAAGQTGYIMYYHQAVVGPFPDPGGYTPLQYQVSSIADTGDYYFEIVNLPLYTYEKFELWDFQVVSGQHTPAVPEDMINGRVWSQSWQFNAELAYNRLFNARFYVYSDDGIVTKLTFSDARIGVAAIFCNPFGCLNTTNFLTDRQSQNFNTFSVFPEIAQYKVFLNDPDSTIYPSGSFGEITGTPYMIPDPAFPPCSGEKQIVVEVNKEGSVDITISFPFGAPATNVNLYTPVVNGINYISWNGKDGLGNPVPDGTLITVNINYVNGLTNLPIWDQERNVEGFIITLVRPLNPAVTDPVTFWDDSQIMPDPWNCPTAPQTVNLTGCTPGSIPGYPGCHPWGVNCPDCHDKMINTWWYGSSSNVTFTELYTSTPPDPIGHDSIRCGAGTVLLHATVLPFETVDWYDTITGGVPLLIGDTSFLTPVLYETTTFYAEARSDSSGCLSVSRTPVTATILPAPVPTISGPSTPCAGTAGHIYSTESGMINYDWQITSGGVITGGLGSNIIMVAWITPGQQSVTVNYSDPNGCPGIEPAFLKVMVIPLPDTAGMINGPPEVCAGSTGMIYSVEPVAFAETYMWTVPPGVIIVTGTGTNTITVDFPPGASPGFFEVFGVNFCGAGYPSPPFPVVIVPSPSADAGPDELTCSDMPFTITQASASGYSFLYWITTGLGILSGDSTLYPTYYPAPGETGDVIFSLIAGNPPCENDTSFMTLSVIPDVTVDAGEDLIVCGPEPVHLSDAAAGNYTGLHWRSSGSGFFDDSFTLHPVYTPSQADSSAGLVILTLTAIAQEPCLPDSSSLQLTLVKPADAYAGTDTMICEGDFLHLGTASSHHAISLAWFTSGDGVFSDPFVLHPDYIPGAMDIVSGQVMLTLEAISPVPCDPAASTLILAITPGPGGTAGPGGAACRDVPFIISGATALNFSGFMWNHNGQGFLLNPGTLSPTYSPAPGETGIVTLTLTVSGLGACAEKTATSVTEIVFYSPPEAEAGPDQEILAGTQAILTGSAAGGSGEFVFSWEPDSLLISPSGIQAHTVNLFSEAVFRIRVTDLVSGCISTDSVTVSISGGPPPECLVIYNVITPNGDGTNDLWIIDCIENYPSNTVIIFDRWGDRIIEFENYDNRSKVWNGTNQEGRPAPDGTYYYIISIPGAGNYSGWVYVRGGSG
jgi:gliding motility-associated-like protein